MKSDWKFLPTVVIWLLFTPCAGVTDDARRLIDLRGSACQHGPSMQPDGHFVAFVFCDSALGTNLGIILSRLTNETDAARVWSIGQRFWQAGPWVTDVTSFAWDPFSDKLYVATDEIYGDGGVFVLDLPQKKYERIYSIVDIDPQVIRDKADTIRAESHFGFIEELNNDERSITVSIRLAYGDGQSTVIGTKTVRLGSGS